MLRVQIVTRSNQVKSFAARVSHPMSEGQVIGCMADLTTVLATMHAWAARASSPPDLTTDARACTTEKQPLPSISRH